MAAFKLQLGIYLDGLRKNTKKCQDGQSSARHLSPRSRSVNHGKKSRCSTVSSVLVHASRRTWQPGNHDDCGVTHGVSYTRGIGVLRVNTQKMLFCGTRHCVVWCEFTEVSAERAAISRVEK